MRKRTHEAVPASLLSILAQANFASPKFLTNVSRACVYFKEDSDF